MTAVILIIDELIDGGIIMSLESSTILERINIKLTEAKKTSKITGDKKEEEKKKEEK